MSIALKAGEYLWSGQGKHICDDNGFALKCLEDTVVEFDSEEIEASILSIVHADRELKGLDPDTALPLPEPEPLLPELKKIPIEP